MTAIKSKAHILQLAQQRLPVPSVEVERLVEENERLREVAQNLMAYVDTPIGRRRLHIDPDCRMIQQARAALSNTQES